jgi:hypothetical protein
MELRLRKGAAERDWRWRLRPPLEGSGKGRRMRGLRPLRMPSFSKRRRERGFRLPLPNPPGTAAGLPGVNGRLPRERGLPRDRRRPGSAKASAPAWKGSWKAQAGFARRATEGKPRNGVNGFGRFAQRVRKKERGAHASGTGDRMGKGGASAPLPTHQGDRTGFGLLVNHPPSGTPRRQAGHGAGTVGAGGNTGPHEVFVSKWYLEPGGAGAQAAYVSAHPEEGLSLAKARLEGRFASMLCVLRDAGSTGSPAPQDERGLGLANLPCFAA